ncbi:serine hydrolase domain-containing protein [Yinghuangia aomiensis]|uniref:Serine hydrolase domain-containing protein n=1 Tax=Yinghuangia aomiensis TaxID=676205 RepID=A0ABP9IFE8_9ACTN
MRKLRNVLLGAAVGLAVMAGTTPAHADNASAVAALQNGANQGAATDYPGVVGALRDGSTVTNVAAGYSINGSSAPADPTSKYRIGSNTKLYTSTVVLQLEAEGKLSIDDTVAKYLPNAVNSNGYDGHNITIRQLLSHTSGLPEYADYKVLPFISLAWWYYYNDLRGSHYTPQNLVDTALLVTPGTPGPHAWHYANTNYILAGMIIQAVTGHDPSVEIQNRIITPLGLSGTSFPVSDTNIYGNFLHGWRLNADGTRSDVSASNVELFWSAGAMISTAQDQASFVSALLGGQLLPPAQMTELKTTVATPSPTDTYGLGITRVVLTECGNKVVWAHGGNILGYHNKWYASEDGTKVAVLAGNENHGGDDTPGQLALKTGTRNAVCRLLS